MFSFFLNKKKKFEDTKVVIKSHKSKDRQYHGLKKYTKRINNDLQNITQKNKGRAIQTPPNKQNGVNSGVLEGEAVLAPPVAPVILLLLQTNNITEIFVEITNTYNQFNYPLANEDAKEYSNATVLP